MWLKSFSAIPAVQPWTNYLTSLSLSFLICAEQMVVSVWSHWRARVRRSGRAWGCLPMSPTQGLPPCRAPCSCGGLVSGGGLGFWCFVLVRTWETRWVPPCRTLGDSSPQGQEDRAFLWDGRGQWCVFVGNLILPFSLRRSLPGFGQWRGCARAGSEPREPAQVHNLGPRAQACPTPQCPLFFLLLLCVWAGGPGTQKGWWGPAEPWHKDTGPCR